MVQDSNGTPTYYGRRDLVNFMCRRSGGSRAVERTSMTLRATFWDLQHGSAAWLSMPNNENVVIDLGSGSSRLVKSSVHCGT